MYCQCFSCHFRTPISNLNQQNVCVRICKSILIESQSNNGVWGTVGRKLPHCINANIYTTVMPFYCMFHPWASTVCLCALLAFRIIIFMQLLEENQREAGMVAQTVFINMWKYTQKYPSWNLLQVKRKANFKTEPNRKRKWMIPPV